MKPVYANITVDRPSRQYLLHPIPIRPFPYLRDVDTGPEELQVLPHLCRLVLGVEDGQLREHAHVSSLETQGSLEEGDELVEVAAVLVVLDQVVQLVSMYNNMEATDLGEAELLSIHAGKADLEGERGERKKDKRNLRLCQT